MTDWFTGNLGEVEGIEHEHAGKAYRFGENRPYELYNDIGINVRVLEPGQPASPYHREDAEEFFVVLGGECLAIVDEQEVPLRKWDFLHTPPGTAHVVVGAGDGPATVLMVGSRKPQPPVHYPVSELAARHGASVSTPTDSPQDAWEQLGWERHLDQVRLPWPPE